MDTLVTLGIIVVVAFAILTSAIKIVQEYERGVIFRLGRLVGAPRSWPICNHSLHRSNAEDGSEGGNARRASTRGNHPRQRQH